MEGNGSRKERLEGFPSKAWWLTSDGKTELSIAPGGTANPQEGKGEPTQGVQGTRLNYHRGKASGGGIV